MKIAVLGGYGVGITMRLAQVPGAGETVLGGRVSHEHGGKGSNQAVAIARWGASPALITAIGRDAAGDAARELWRDEGVDAAAVVSVEAATMTGVILVDESGENRIAIAAGALEQLSTSDIDVSADLIREAEALVISLEIPIAAAQRAIEIARAAGVPIVLNPAPASALPEPLWMAADLLVPNQIEARTLLADYTSSDSELALALHRRTGHAVVLTRGDRGAIIAENGAVVSVPAVPVAAVDTTGAGDTFVAVLTVEYLEHGSLQAAVVAACAAAAISVTHPGVVQGLPRRQRNPLETAGAS